MNGGYTADITVLHQAAKGLRKSEGDVEGILKTVLSPPLDIPQLACTQTDLIHNRPTATGAYAAARGDAEFFLRQLMNQLNYLADTLDTVAQHYQRAEAANTAAARSAQP
jgi:hypothetical protein